jgi:hypothetical protein
MDSPVRAKVMATLRSAFFQDTVKDEDVRILELYQLRTRRSIYLQCLMVKVGRSAFYKGILDAGRTEANEPQSDYFSCKY